MYYYPCSRSRSFGPIGVPKHELGNEKERLVGRASVPAAFGDRLPACAPHRQDAGATKNFSGQSLMGLRRTRKL